MSLAKNALNYDKLGLFKFRIITGGGGGVFILYLLRPARTIYTLETTSLQNRRSKAQRR